MDILLQILDNLIYLFCVDFKNWMDYLCYIYISCSSIRWPIKLPSSSITPPSKSLASITEFLSFFKSKSIKISNLLFEVFDDLIFAHVNFFELLVFFKLFPVFHFSRKSSALCTPYQLMESSVMSFSI